MTAKDVIDLIAAIKTPDDKVRGPAWQGADRFGAEAVKPLVIVMADPEFETARCARRALWKVTRAAGRPGNANENSAVERELVSLLPGVAGDVGRELLWMISEIGGDDSVAPVAALLGSEELRDDARCVLTRLPGDKAVTALQRAMSTAPEDFKFALAESLRARGVKVAGYASKKRAPTKQTTVIQPQKP